MSEATTMTPPPAFLRPDSEKRLNRFQLLQGRAAIPDKDGKERIYSAMAVPDKDGEPGWPQNNIIETYLDLDKMFNGKGVPPKFLRLDPGDPSHNPYLSQPAPGETMEEFERRQARLKGVTDNQMPQPGVTGGPPASPVQPINPPREVKADKPLHKMTVKELESLCDEEEIPWVAGTTREQFLAKLKAANIGGPPG